MPGNGTIGGGDSLYVFFRNDVGDTGDVHDHNAVIGRTKVIVTFPNETNLVGTGRQGNIIEVKLKDGETVHFDWRGPGPRFRAKRP